MTGDAESELQRVEGCDLCRAKKMTGWYHEDESCWIAECEICEVPLVGAIKPQLTEDPFSAPRRRSSPDSRNQAVGEIARPA